MQSLKEHFQRGPKVSQSQHRSAQHLSFCLVALLKDQLFVWGHINFPYFARLKFLLLTALINNFLLTFWSHKTCYKSFAIPIAYTGYDGCPSHHRFPQAKLIFPLDLPKKINPCPLQDLPGMLTLVSYSCFDFSHRCFFFSHFLLFCRDSSDCSIRALPISWPLNNSILSFLEHMSLFSTF